MKRQVSIFFLTLISGILIGGFYVNFSLKKNQNHVTNQVHPNLELIANSFDVFGQSDLCENVISESPLIVGYGENETLNCETESGTWEGNYCSGVRVCLELKKLDSLSKVLNDRFDRLIDEQNSHLKNPTTNEKNSDIIDFRKLKKIHNVSFKLYLIYANLERMSLSYELGTATSRTFYENTLYLQLLQNKTKELSQKIQDYKYF
jgi:hypothetical protein